MGFPIPSPPARASTSCPRPGPLREPNPPRSPSFSWCSTTSFWRATWRFRLSMEIGYSELERSTIFHGKIHYFDWAIFHSYVELPEGSPKTHVFCISTNATSISMRAIPKSSLFCSDSSHIAMEAMDDGNDQHDDFPSFNSI